MVWINKHNKNRQMNARPCDHDFYEEVEGDLHGRAHHKGLVGEYTVNQKLWKGGISNPRTQAKHFEQTHEKCIQEL